MRHSKTSPQKEKLRPFFVAVAEGAEQETKTLAAETKTKGTMSSNDGTGASKGKTITSYGAGL